MNPVWQAVGTPDLDGDGKPDLLWHNQSTGQLVYWLLDGVKLKPGGSGPLTPAVVARSGRRWARPTWTGTASPTSSGTISPPADLVYWLMDGVKLKPGGSGHLTPSVVNPVWKVAGTPDLDRDGHPDILWHNQATGQLIYWLLDGVKLKPGGSGTLSCGCNPVWELEPGS